MAVTEFDARAQTNLQLYARMLEPGKPADRPLLATNLAPIIHEHFCCNRRSAATTRLWPAGSPLKPSTYFGDWRPSFFAPVPVWATMGQAPPWTAEPVPWAPRAGLATRLSDFATNRHEYCGLGRA